MKLFIFFLVTRPMSRHYISDAAPFIFRHAALNGSACCAIEPWMLRHPSCVFSLPKVFLQCMLRHSPCIFPSYYKLITYTHISYYCYKLIHCRHGYASKLNNPIMLNLFTILNLYTHASLFC